MPAEWPPASPPQIPLDGFTLQPEEVVQVQWVDANGRPSPRRRSEELKRGLCGRAIERW